jgi:hypothetical protein
VNRSLTKALFIGFSSTPILVTLIFILGLCMALDYVVEPNEDISLVCHSDVYDAKQSMFLSGGLKLDVHRVGQQIELHIVYTHHGSEQAEMTSYGELVHISAPILTYEIRLQDADLKHDEFLEKISNYMGETIDIVKKSINDGDERNGQPFYIKVLEMDKSQGSVIIQISERNALWACKIQ